MFFRKTNIDPAVATDAQLIEGCLRGERRFQKELYDRYSGKLLAVCCRYCKDRDGAQDVLHEGFIKAFKNLHRFKGEGSFEGWLRRIMVNAALESFRKDKNLQLVDDITAATHHQVRSKASEKLEADDIMELVQQLPSGFRIVFNLYVMEGYSHKDIAKELGISVGTSKSQLSRARAALQEMIRFRDIETYETYAQSNR